MNFKDQLEKLSEKFIQNFAPGGVVGNPQFGIKVVKQYRDQDDKEIVELSDGKRLYVDSPEYKQLYSEGLLYGESPDKITYPQESANPAMELYKRVESMHPFSEFVQPYFEGQSGAIARGTGQSQDKLENMPEDYKNRYDEFINKKWAEAVFSLNPQNKDESRGEYLNRITQGMNPRVLKSLYDNLPKDQAETLWQSTRRGLENLIENQTGQGDIIQRIQNNPSLSDFEKQKMIQEAQRNSYLSNVGANFQTLSALTVPSKMVQSAYRPGYSFQDALQGRQNKASIIEDIGTDPLNLLGIGLTSKLPKGLSAVNKFNKESKVLNNTEKLDLSHFANEDEFYRVIVGDDAYNDILESGLIRTKRPNDFQSIQGGINLDRRGTTEYPSFSKGEVSIEYAQNNPEHYIISSRDPSLQPSKRGRHGKGSTMFPTGEDGKHLPSLSADKTNIYKHIGEGKYESVPNNLNSGRNIVGNINKFSISQSSLPNKTQPDPAITLLKNIGKVVDNRVVSLLPGHSGRAQRALESGNKWQKEWYNNPITQDRISENIIRNPGAAQGWMDMRQNIKDENYKGIFQSNRSSLNQFLLGSPHIHADNYGVSYTYSNPSRVIDPYRPVNTNYTQNFVDKYRTPETIRSTAIHEGNHGIVRERELSNVQELNDLRQDDIVRNYLSQNPEKLDLVDYFTDNMEIYARMMELRAANKWVPGEQITKSMMEETFNKGLKGDYPINKIFFQLMNPEKLRKALNTLPAVGVGAFLSDTGDEEPRTYQQGGLIREDGTMKGKGFFGAIPTSRGHMTEVSRSFEWNGKENLVPSLVPGLTAQQILYLQQNEGYGGDNTMNEKIDDNAYRYARLRESQNQPFFATPEEEGKLPPPSYQKGGTIKSQLNNLAQRYNTM